AGVITQFKPNQNGYTFTLTPGERREMIDFVGLPKAQGGLALSSAIGQLVFNGCKANQDCTPDATSGENPNFRNISVETRIYSVDAAASGSPQTLPSNGQLFAGLPWYSYVSTNAYMTVEQIPTATQPTSDATANGCSDGCPAFFAYGSLLDNATGDAITLEAQYLKAWTLDQVQCIYNLTCKGGTYKPHRAAKK